MDSFGRRSACFAWVFCTHNCPPPLFVKCVEWKLLYLYADSRFYKQVEQLFPIHEADGSFSNRSCLILGTLRKIACCDNNALLVGSQSASQFTNRSCLNVWLPTLHLHGSVDLSDIAYSQNPAHVNPAITTI